MKKVNPEKIISKISTELHGYRILDYLLKDDNLEEIMILNDKKEVYVYHSKNGMMITNITLTNAEIIHIIEKITQELQRKIDQQTPILNARLKEGSRIHTTLPPISAYGPILTIRKF